MPQAVPRCGPALTRPRGPLASWEAASAVGGGRWLREWLFPPLPAPSRTPGSWTGTGWQLRLREGGKLELLSEVLLFGRGVVGRGCPPRDDSALLLTGCFIPVTPSPAPLAPGRVGRL